MAHLPVQCQNCGARYKIPDTFKSDQAKCKACGTMIDVAAARAAGDDDPSAPPAPAPATGGTRKPRQTATAGTSGRRRKSEAAEDKVSASAGRRASSRRSRRGEDSDEGDEAGRRRYEKKKDNTPVIAGVIIVALAAVAGIFWMLYSPGTPADTGGTGKVAEKPAAKPAAAKGQAGKDAAGDTKPDDKGSSAANAAEGTAKKADAAAKDAAAKDAAAKKAAAAKKSSRPKSKRAQAIKADEEVKGPEDVFKPASALQELPRPAGLSDEKLAEINSLLDDLQGGGLPEIKANNKLPLLGIQIVPIATNRLLKIDFSTYKGNDYAYRLGKIIGNVTDFGLGWEPVLAGEDPDPKLGNRNAGRVWDLHQMARLYWHSTETFEKWQASRKK